MNLSSVSGKKIVYLLFFLAVCLCLLVFFTGLHEKHLRQSDPGSLISNPKTNP